MTAYTPNLPALIAALPGPGTEPGAGYRKPQTEFTRERQVLFCENLSVTGSVRSAAVAAGVSHQTAYRARRSQAAFRVAWDGAMVAARAQADAVLAARAIDGIEETVFYHGEAVATRTRYSDRLLLAHLARLDRLAAHPAAQAVADDWDAAMERFARGEDPVAPAPQPAAPERPEKSSPGPCNTRSMSPAARWDDEALADDDDGDEDDADALCDYCGAHCDGAPDGEGPCFVERVCHMDAARPAGTPDVTAQARASGFAPIDVEDAQLAAFEAGRDGWWLVLPDGPAAAGGAARAA